MKIEYGISVFLIFGIKYYNPVKVYFVLIELFRTFFYLALFFLSLRLTPTILPCVSDSYNWFFLYVDDLFVLLIQWPPLSSTPPYILCGMFFFHHVNNFCNIISSLLGITKKLLLW